MEYKYNSYYHKELENTVCQIVPEDCSVLLIGSRNGDLLGALHNKTKTGVEFREEFISLSKKRHKRIKFVHIDELLSAKTFAQYDYIVVNHTFSDVDNVQDFVSMLNKFAHNDTRIVVLQFNFLWKPILDIARYLKLHHPLSNNPNWLSVEDVVSFMYLENFEHLKSNNSFIFPFELNVFSAFVNKYIAKLPIINSFCLTNILIFRPAPSTQKYPVSIVIPARNEAGNMRGVLKKIPKLGTNTEVIFVEGGSTDDTYNVIKKEIKKYKGPLTAKVYKQKGRGKADAVWLGFSKAKNDLLMILDADLTVDPSELTKFYLAASNKKGDLVMGSRLIYPMEKEAMRTLNILGNKLFSLAFTYLLGQRIKDTLCGTKVISRKNYNRIVKNRKVLGDFDPFGDFDLIFGSAKLNLRILEIPVRYKERVYGSTNISRFKHGLILVRMVMFAANKIKFI